MERLLMDKLIQWKNKSNRKPLILKGARQVGKTWLMKEFGAREFDKVAYVNFDNNTNMRDAFEMDFDIERILMAINLETSIKVTPGNTLIIFDEIQEAPKAISALKYFCENAREYAVIAAGSLLGVAIHEGVSFPVGKVEILKLHPLSFREFLMAVDEAAMAELLNKKDYGLMSAFQDKYMDWLKKYYYIGGMPEVVLTFAENKDFAEVRELQKNILAMYEDDFSKHVSDRELPRMRLIWNSIPVQLAKENKKFFFGQIKQGARAKDFEIAIEWMLDCGLIQKVHRVNKPGMPLKAYIEFSAFKIFLLDVGLLGALSDLNAKSILEGNSIFEEFKGALTEQYVVQQLASETDYTPFYFSPERSNVEIDVMVQKESDVVPIEVRAAENLRSKSLKTYCEKYKPGYAVRTSMSAYYQQEWMTNIPLWAIANL